MGANNLYFPSVQDAYRFGSKGVFTIINDTKTGLPLKISIDKFFEQAYNLGYISNELTADELAAINGANNPNAGNVFATMQDIPTNVSELNNDAGYITSAPNFATDNLTFTANRVHTFGNYNLGINSSNVNSLFNITNSVFAWGFSVFQNKPFEDAVYFSSVSGRAVYGISDTAVGIQGVNVDGSNYGVVALGKNDGTGKALRASGGVKFVAPSSSFLDTAFGIRNFTDTAYLYDFRSTGEFYINSNFTGYNFNYVDLGNGFPVFTLDAPTGGSVWQARRVNGTARYYDYVTAGGTFVVRPNQYEIRDITTNDVHAIKDTEGRWLFTKDPTGLATPNSNARIYVAESQGLNYGILVQTTGSTNGIFSQTNGGQAVWGSSNGASGGYFTSTNQYGVTAISTNSYGIYVAGTSGLGADIRGTVKTVSPSSSSLDTAFGVRNFTDTAWMFHIAANGNGEYLSGNHSFGDVVNPNAKLQGVTNAVGVVALRGYHYGSGGEAIVGLADGANAVAVKGTASGTGAIAGKFVGYYALGLSGRILDETQSTTPTMPQDVVANEVALLATLTQGQWYYLDNGDGTGTVKVKL